MVPEKNKDYVLGVLSRKGCSQEKGVLLLDAKMHLHDWDKDSFWSTCEALTDEKLIWTSWGAAFFTLKGCRRAENLLDAPDDESLPKKMKKWLPQVLKRARPSHSYQQIRKIFGERKAGAKRQEPSNRGGVYT